MPEPWIDEHTGAEAVARPDFRAQLRAVLSAELEASAHRRLPWRAIGWTAAAAAVVVATVIVVTNDGGQRVVGPATTTTSPTTSSTTAAAGSLRDRIVDVEWTVMTIDGVDLTANPPPTFLLRSDGGVVGFDGCNQYAFDLSLAGGWTLTDDLLGLDQQFVSTAKTCPDAPDAINPIADGTRLELSASGILTLTSPSGQTYTATNDAAPGVDQPAHELVVPLEGGPVLQPTILATSPITADEGQPIAAVLPDRLVVVAVAGGRLEGSVHSFDLTGAPLGDTTLETIPDGLAGIALGADDWTLYIITNSATENSQTAVAYRLDGALWRSIETAVVDQNNDGTYEVTGQGLVLGDTVVIAAQTPDSSAPRTYWKADTAPPQVLRVDADGSTTIWAVVELFENFSIPPTPIPFNGGALYLGNSSGTDEQRYIGVLHRDGSSEFFRPDGWYLTDVAEGIALFVRVTDGALQLGATFAT